MKIFVVGLFAGLWVVVGSAYAGSCGGGDHVHTPQDVAAEYFDKIDRDGDKTLTKAEFEASSFADSITSFKSLRPDSSGLVTKKSFIETFVKVHLAPNTKA